MEQVEALINVDGAKPKKITVLFRLYAQMDHLEAETDYRHISWNLP